MGVASVENFGVIEMESVTEDLYAVQKLEAILRKLSPERLRVAADFLAYLDERESNEATEELLSIPNFKENFKEVMQGIERDDVVSFKSIHRHVLRYFLLVRLKDSMISLRNFTKHGLIDCIAKCGIFQQLNK